MNRKVFFIEALMLIQCFLIQKMVALDIATYENQYQSLCFQEKLVNDATPYLLPHNHPLKHILDSIFSTRNVIKNEKTFANAGFITLRAQKTSGITLARHPQLQGYVVKLYLDSQKHYRKAFSQQDWLIQRCRGAARLRAFIIAGHYKHFTVPNKWLYELPPQSIAPGEHTYVVVATYMHLVEKKETYEAWKNKATKEDLRELFVLMKNGGASGALAINTPYTKEGKFVFIDTEYPDRFFQWKKLAKVAHYFSHENKRYWHFLMQLDALQQQNTPNSP